MASKIIHIDKQLENLFLREKLPTESYSQLIKRLIGLKPEPRISQKKLEKAIDIPRLKPGPKPLYPFSQMKVGDKLVYLWERQHFGKTHPAIVAAEKYNRLAGYTLDINWQGKGVTITRYR